MKSLKTSLYFLAGFVILCCSFSIAEEMIANGGFDDEFDWQVYDMAGNGTSSANFGVEDGNGPKFGKDGYLQLTGEGTYSNILIWQELLLVGGQTYMFSGAFKDLTNDSLHNFWCEIYLSTEEPVDGTDWTPPEGANTDKIIGFNTWDGCGSGIDGTFQDDGCIQPNTRYYTAPGDSGENVIVYFGIKSGVWTDGAALFFDVAIDEVSLVEESANTIEQTEIAINTFELQQNYPNPFNPRTSISYTIPYASHVELTILDILGKKIQTLVNKRQEAGTYISEFQANGLASGAYIVRLSTESHVVTRRMTLIK